MEDGRRIHCRVMRQNGFHSLKNDLLLLSQNAMMTFPLISQRNLPSPNTHTKTANVLFIKNIIDLSLPCLPVYVTEVF